MVKTCKNIGMIKRGEEQEGRRNAGEKIGEKKETTWRRTKTWTQTNWRRLGGGCM